MARDIFDRDFTIGQLNLKTEELFFEVKVTGNATAASKLVSNDGAGSVIPRFKGLTAAADALETLTWTTAVDATNAVFGILINGANIAHGAGIRKVKRVSVTQLLATGSAIAVTANNALQAYISPNGNIALEITATGTDLSSAAVTATFCVSIVFENL